MAAIATVGLVALYLVPDEEAELASTVAWFEGKVAPFGEDSGFADFIREQAGETVDLGATLESRHFTGTTDRMATVLGCVPGKMQSPRRVSGGAECRLPGAAALVDGFPARPRGRFQVRELPPEGRWRIYELLAK